MSSSDESDDEETNFPSNSESQLYCASLKPALDNIFAEVQANIPLIGSDSDSETSNSDEEPVIFNRNGDLTSLAHTEDLTATFKDAFAVDNSESQTILHDVINDCGTTTTSKDSSLSMPGLSESCTADISKTTIEEKLNTSSNASMKKDTDGSPQHTEDSSSHHNVLHSNTFQLNLARLADIDFANLMEQVNEVRVPLWPDLNPLEADSNNNAEPESDLNSSSSDELMRQLINLSEKQQGEAVSTCKSQGSNHTMPATEPNKDAKFVDSWIQADGLYNDVETMATQATASIGVSASFGLSSSDTDDHANKKRGTIFIDLRNQKPEPWKPRKESHSVSSSIQRILGIQEKDSSSSSSEDENDLELWHEQRRRIKQGIAARNQAAVVGRTTGKVTTKQQGSAHGSESQQASQIRNTIKSVPFEEKRPRIVEEKKIKSKKNDRKVQANKEQNYILINKHISPTETVAEFVLIPSLEFDRLAAESKKLKDSPAKKEQSLGKKIHEGFGGVHVEEEKGIMLCSQQNHASTIPEKKEQFLKKKVKEAWGEIQVDEQKAIKLGSQRTHASSKPEEKLPTHVKQVDKEPVKQVDKQTIKPVNPVKTTKGGLANTINQQQLHKHTQNNKESIAKLSKKELEQQKILNQKIKAKKARIQQRLESVKRERETRTVGGRVCIAAPQTPVVFDVDASYETAPMSLPDNYANKHYLLLSVSLHACGEISLGGNKLSGGRANNRNTQIGTDAHTFNLLLAWLLSLVPVPEKTYYADFALLCESPFYVIGLQQTWHEGELSVKLGICNTDIFQPSKAKQTGRGNTFYTSVSRFLKTNTLCSVMSKLSSYPATLIDAAIGNKNLSSLITINSDPQAMIRVFGGEPGFYWKTLEVDDSVDIMNSNIEYCGPEINNTVMLVEYEAFHDPSCMFDILNRVWIEGLDLAGIRLLHTDNIPLEERPGLDQSICRVFHREGPILALAIRGPNALLQWLEVVGPNDVWLARRTNPSSLRVIYSDDKDDHLFYCPRHTERANVELARWFGGRVPPGDTLNIGSEDIIVQRPRSGSRGRKDEQLPTSALHTPLPSPPCTLVASTESLIVIVASPIILPRCFGYILSICFARGFALYGIRRIRFHPPHLKDSNRDALGLTAAQIPVFCPMKTYTGNLSTSLASTFDEDGTGDSYSFSSASTMFCLRKENGAHHSASLVKTLTEELARVEFLPIDLVTKDQDAAIKMCFAVAPYSDYFANVVGSKMKQMPNSNMYAAASLSHSFYSNPELEQVCVLTLLKEKATRHCHAILDYLTLNAPRLSDMMYDDLERDYCGFELLGIKLVSSLTLHQAKEFTPFEIGDKLWQSSLKPLTSGPALIIALRGIDAFQRLREFIHSFYGGSPRKRPEHTKEGACPDMFMSSTPEIAYRQLTAIFFEHELYADNSKRSSLHHVPDVGRDTTFDIYHASPTPKQKGKKSGRGNNPQDRGYASGALLPDDVPIIASLLAGPRPLNTVCMIKPDVVPRHVGKVLKRLARDGFQVVNMRMDMLTDGDARAIVNRDWGCAKIDENDHVRHLTSGPCLTLSIQRENAVGKLLDVLGPSIPEECRHESQFYLRGSYGMDRIRNALYGSCSYNDAVKDHKLLFTQGICCSPTDDLKAEGIPCLASDKTFSVDAQRTLADVPEEFDSQSSNDEAFMTLLPPSLLELNCILLMPDLLRSQVGPSSVKQTPGFIEVIDGLINAGSQLVGVRMLRLNDHQAAHCARMYSDSLHSDMKPYQLAAQLSNGPCLVLAILRDGAVTSFETLLANRIKSNSLAPKYGKYVLAAKSFKKARSLLECFFDRLMPNKKAQILCKQ